MMKASPLTFILDEAEYSLWEQKGTKGALNKYRIEAPSGDIIETWFSDVDLLNLTVKEIYASTVYARFRDIVDERTADSVEFELDDDDSEPWFSPSGITTPKPTTTSWKDSWKKWETPKSTGFLDKLNNSDTLVVHCKDPTTEMLCQIYDGKGWDVLRDGNIDKDELHQLLQSHDRIVMLGHGSPSGLFNRQGWGSVIGDQEAPFLKDKKLFAIWCNADKFFEKHGIGKGYLITGNIPSDSSEASWVGYHVPQKWMDENITYWSKLMADVVERALEGDAKGAAQYVCDKYREKYIDGETDVDKIGVTQYNIDRTKVQ